MLIQGSKSWNPNAKAFVMLGLFTLLPLLIILVSIGYLFIDLKRPKAVYIALATGFVQLGIFLSLIFLVTWVDSDHEALNAKTNELSKRLDHNQHLQSLALARLAIDADSTDDAFRRAALFGFTQASSALQRLEDADTALKKLQSALKHPFDRKDISVLQIPEETDQLVVAGILRKWGYEAYFTTSNGAEESTLSAEVKQPKDDVKQTIEADGSIALSLNFDRPSPSVNAQQDNLKPLARANVLLLGAKANLLDAKITALILVRAGVDIKHIKKIKNNTPDNVRTILIDFNKLYERRSTLSPGRILALKRIR